LAGRPKWVAGQPSPPFSPPLLSPLPQPPPIWETMEGLWPHGLAIRPPPLAGRGPRGSPIKELPRGASSFIPQAHKQTQVS
jgi:hypothetical protein